MRTPGILLAVVLLQTSCGTGSGPAPKEAAPKELKAVYTKVDPQTAGSVKGSVTFSGAAKPAKKVNMDEDPECAKLHKTPLTDDAFVLDAKTKGLANVFVYVKQGLDGKTFEPPAEPVTVTQKGCWFSPRVVGVQVGQAFKVANGDPLTHNVHPLAQVNREWNQSQDAGAEPVTRKFTKQEVMVKVKCNIHPWMRGWIGVVDSPYYAVTAADGSFEIRNLPPGDYVLEAWHEELGTKQVNVTIPPSGKPELNIKY